MTERALIQGILKHANPEMSAEMAEGLARYYTLTSTPQRATTRGPGRWLRTTNEGGETAAINHLMLPFVRTNANVVEKGFERLPGVGVAVNAFSAFNKKAWRDVVVEQGLGIAVTTGAYFVGLNSNSEKLDIPGLGNVAQDAFLLKLMSNAFGVYSLPASVGFLAGIAARDGKDAMLSVAQTLSFSIPMPQTSWVTDTAKFLSASVEKEGISFEDVPKSFVPDIVGFLANEASKESRYQDGVRIRSGGSRSRGGGSRSRSGGRRARPGR